MKVLYFHQHFNTPQGTVGNRSYKMSRKLIEAGHSVVIVCGSYDGGVTGLNVPFINGMRRGLVDGIEVIEFELPYSNSDGLLKRTGLFIRFALKSIGVALSEQYDLVFATTTPLTAGIPGIFARWFRRKPFVFEVRDLWPELPKAMGVIKNPIILGLMSFLEWVSYRSAHRCIGLSPGIIEGIKKRGVAEHRTYMIPNGCDLTLFSNVLPKRPTGVKENDLLAIFTGTHGVANGVDAALDAALVLKQQGIESIKLCFIGSGKLKQKLIERTQKENIDNCIFLDPVSKIELARFLSGADIGMQLLQNIPAFYYGTSPNKFFDYISSGLPVLNNYPGWLADMIEEYQCGYAVSPDDSKAFAKALIHADNNRESLQLKGLNGSQLAVQKFDWNILSDQFVECLEGVNK